MDLIECLRAALGVDRIEPIDAGHQSQVFRAVGLSGPIVIKVVDASLVDRTELEVRLDVTDAIASFDSRVCRPLLVGDTRIVELSSSGGVDHFVTCQEFATGRELDVSRTADAASMGSALARLHHSLLRLPRVALPVVAPLRGLPAERLASFGTHQLLHGDFNTGNLRESDGVVRIFDFDDCGYGPPAFDVANALYMVLFDVTVKSSEVSYPLFRHAFVHGYGSVSGADLADDLLDELIHLRIAALRAWLDDLAHAPVGIRTATPAWLATLRSFVDGR